MKYEFRNEFELHYVYTFLAEKSTLVSGIAYEERGDEADQNEKQKLDRPVEVEGAKRRKEEKINESKMNDKMNKSQNVSSEQCIKHIIFNPWFAIHNGRKDETQCWN